MVLRSEAITGGPIVRFGTKWPSITSRCRTVPPPASAAFASAPNCAKFADNIDGARSMTAAIAALLTSLTKLEYTRGARVTSAKLAIFGQLRGRVAHFAT